MVFPVPFPLMSALVFISLLYFQIGIVLVLLGPSDVPLGCFFEVVLFYLHIHICNVLSWYCFCGVQ